MQMKNDKTHIHRYLFEFDVGKDSNILTADGIENIVHHKYVGGQYTYLDDFFNPFWTNLTNLLPIWLAPNMVTTLGGLHCLFVYIILWYYSPNMDKDTVVNDWLLLLSGYCQFMYYTFDCMDGKQSRRTKTSSPLGQLFDHGMDCFCNIIHPATAAAYLMNGGTIYFFLLMSPLQFTFFTAQWEEYYTHKLPHGCGKLFGVTEVNYGLSLLSVLNAFIDRKAFWFQSLHHAIETFSNNEIRVGEGSFLSKILQMQLNEVGIIGWVLLLTSQCLLSFRRTLSHLPSSSVKISALSKLVSPLCLAVSPFILPNHLLQNRTRLISISMGLIFDLITKKMIVFSMAKMCFAMIQFEILPYIAAIAFIVWSNATSQNSNDIQEVYNLQVFILRMLCVWNFYRLLRWCRLTILQISNRLDIYCFTIKHKKV